MSHNLAEVVDYAQHGQFCDIYMNLIRGPQTWARLNMGENSG